MSSGAAIRQTGARRLLSDRRLWLALLAAALLGIGAWAFLAKAGGNGRTVLVVDGRETGMEYFLKRVAMSDREPLVMLKTLAYEDIMRREAPNPPFGIALADDEIDAFIRLSAEGGSGPMAEAEFEQWLRQQLNETRLNEEEYRAYMASQLLYDRMTEVLARRQPTVAPQVRLGSIAGMDAEKAASVVRRIAAGERFSDLAAELNTMPRLKASGGDIGWYTRDELDTVFAAQVFDVLKVGETGKPFAMPNGTFNIVQVTQRDAARPIGEEALKTIRSALLEKWLDEQFPRYAVQFRGLTGGYDSETDAWVRGKVAEMRQISAPAS